ncbi:MAG: SDR family oxidoreductase [Bacteroidota bacterium]
MQKSVLITGASSGVGAAAARLFARHGYRVNLVARNEARLADLANEIGETASWFACDASTGASVQHMAEQVIDETGLPDVIINCAGLGQWKRIEDTSPDEAHQMIGAPYLAAYNVTQVFMAAMLQRKSGVIIHVNSPACYMPWPSAVGYTASRFALRGLHEALSQDLAGSGVCSCHVVLGRIDSEYFTHNTGVEDRMPRIAATIRTISVDECSRLLLKLADHPRRQVIYPFMLKLYYWTNAVAPALTRWLLRVTAPDPDVPAQKGS